MAGNEELVQTFNELDVNGDGQITTQEFRNAMSARGEEVSDAEIESIFADADSGQDGKISLTGSTAAWNRVEQRDQHQPGIGAQAGSLRSLAMASATPGADDGFWPVTMRPSTTTCSA